MLFYSIVNEQFFSVSRLSFYFAPEAGAKNNFRFCVFASFALLRQKNRSSERLGTTKKWVSHSGT